MLRERSMEDATKTRKPEHKINTLFVKRWSPRAMSGEEMSDEEIFSLFEAARWAPSSSNLQPWRFIYAKRNTQHWDRLFNLLNEGNRLWCKNAAVLAVVVSATMREPGKPLRTHSYDTGSAWENLALQGASMGFVVHGMAGFDYDKAKSELHVPDDFQVEAMFAAGKPGKKQDLPESLQAREIPSDRKKIKEFIFEGQWR